MLQHVIVDDGMGIGLPDDRPDSREHRRTQHHEPGHRQEHKRGGRHNAGSLKEPMQDLAALGPTFNKVADLGSPMKELAGLRDPMVQLSQPVSAIARLTPAQLAASVILATVVFFVLLFLTIWSAIRLALRHHVA
jgi:hypothetical protein